MKQQKNRTFFTNAVDSEAVSANFDIFGISEVFIPLYRTVIFNISGPVSEMVSIRPLFHEEHLNMCNI